MNPQLGDPPFSEEDLLRHAGSASLWRPALAESLLRRFPVHERFAERAFDKLSAREPAAGMEHMRIAGCLEALSEGRMPKALPPRGAGPAGPLERGLLALLAWEEEPGPARRALRSLLPDLQPLFDSPSLLAAGRFASSCAIWKKELRSAAPGSMLESLCRMQLVWHGWLLRDPESWRGLRLCSRERPQERILLEQAEARLTSSAELLREQAWIQECGEGVLLGRAPAFREFLRALRRASRSRDPLLLLGESGCGKELAAQACYRLSGCEGPFVPLNCAALPPTLAEGELFGSGRGAFTGAVDRPGLVERSAEGVLFLDEVGALPPALQAKLLRVLDSGEFYRVGETRPRRSRFRLLSATCEDRRLEGESFRRDLLQRLSAIRLRLPALRERPEDLPLLTAAFLHEAGARLLAADLLEERAQERLRRCRWPGNVRQLRYTLRRLASLPPVERHRTLEDLEADTPSKEGDARLPVRLKEARDWAERSCLIRALEECGEDKPAAARRLGISLPTLYARLQRLGRGAPGARRSGARAG